jgi:hypothetical protein
VAALSPRITKRLPLLLPLLKKASLELSANEIYKDAA